MLALQGVALTVLRLAPWDLGTPWIQLPAFFPLTLMLTAAGLGRAALAMCLRPGGGGIIPVTFIIALLSLQAGMVLPRVLQAPEPVLAARAAAAGVDRPSGP